MFDSYPDIVRPKDLCAMLGFGRTKIYKLIHSGVIPSYRIGGNYVIRKKDIINFLNQLQ